MKKYCALSILLLLLSVNLYSQVGENIIINKSYYGKMLKHIFWDIGKSYNLDMDFSVDDVKTDIVPGRSYGDKTLEFVMDELCRELDLSYKIGDLQVFIRKKGTIITAEEKEYLRKSNFNMSGVIKDKESGEALPYAQILVQGTSNGATTNVDGYFTLFNILTDTSVLEVVYVGYNKKYVQLTPKLVSEPLTIKIHFQSTDLEGVTITADRQDLLRVSDEISTVSMTPKDISSLPSLGEKDIFRSFQLLPGISGSNESSAGLYVRGGTPDQNLILYDGFTVYHQEHLFGMYSAFNTNAIKDVQLYKGGFESKYGGRLSSVMDIVGKTGNENEFNLGGDISFLSFNGYTEIPLGGKGSVFIAARRSYKGLLYDKFFDAFQQDNSATESQTPKPGKMGNRTMESSEPTSYFYDINGKATYRFTEKDIVSLSFFNGQDDLDNSQEINRSRGSVNVSGGITDLTKWGNIGGSLKWSRKWSDKFYMNNLVSFSDYYSIRDRSVNRTIANEDGTSTDASRSTLEDNTLKDLSYKMDNEYKTGENNQILFGAQFANYNINYDYSQNDTISILNMDDNGSLYSFYVQDKWKPFKNLSVLPGLRASYYSITNKTYFEPRFQMTYNFKPGCRFH